VAAGPSGRNHGRFLQHRKLYWLAQDNIAEIERIWQQHQNLAQTANGHMVRSWLADCHLAKRRWEDAVSLLRISLDEVTSNHIQRGIIAIRIKLVAVALEQGKLEESAAELEEISQLSSENLDRQYMAFIQSYYGHLYSMQNNIPPPRCLYQSPRLFERLGMRREAQKVRTTLDDIDNPTATGLSCRSCRKIAYFLATSKNSPGRRIFYSLVPRAPAGPVGNSSSRSTTSPAGHRGHHIAQRPGELVLSLLAFPASKCRQPLSSYAWSRLK